MVKDTGTLKVCAFVDAYQMEDRGLLNLGDDLEVDFRGQPVERFAFFVPGHTKIFRRTGVFECLIAGEIMRVQVQPSSTIRGGVWQQVLIDCGFPVVLEHFGSEPLSLLPVARDEAPLEISKNNVGAFIGGVIILKAEISFSSRRSIAPPVKAKVDSIDVVRITEESVIEQETVRRIDFLSPNGKGALGVILELEIVPRGRQLFLRTGT